MSSHARMLRHPLVIRWVGAAVLAVAATLLMWQRLGSPARGIAWAEDSGRFLNERLAFGPLAVLWQPYDGYFHLIPRIIVDVAVAIGPIDRYAIIVSALSCCVVGVVCGLVFILSKPFVSAWPLRVLLAAVPALTPLAPVEIAGNTANLHWYLLFLAPWLFAYRPRSWWSATGIAIAALAVTSTEIQAIIFLPLLLLNRRNVRAIPVAAVAVLGVLAQVTATITHPRSASHQSGITSFWDMTAGYFAQPIAGSWNADVQGVGATIDALGWWVVVVPGLLLLACIVSAVVRARPETRWMLIALTIGSLAVWYGGLTLNMTLGTNWTSFGPSDWGDLIPLRYAAAASMLLLAALVLSADVLIGRGAWLSRSVGGVLVAAILVAALFAVAGINGRIVPLRESGPVWAGQVQYYEPTCAAHPESSVNISAVPVMPMWQATIPCSLIVRDE